MKWHLLWVYGLVNRSKDVKLASEEEDTGFGREMITSAMEALGEGSNEDCLHLDGGGEEVEVCRKNSWLLITD